MGHWQFYQAKFYYPPEDHIKAKKKIKEKLRKKSIIFCEWGGGLGTLGYGAQGGDILSHRYGKIKNGLNKIAKQNFLEIF